MLLSRIEKPAARRVFCEQRYSVIRFQPRAAHRYQAIRRYAILGAVVQVSGVVRSGGVFAVNAACRQCRACVQDVFFRRVNEAHAVFCRVSENRRAQQRVAVFALHGNDGRHLRDGTACQQVFQRLHHTEEKGAVADRDDQALRNAPQLFIDFIDVGFGAFVKEGVIDVVGVIDAFCFDFGAADIGAVVATWQSRRALQSC